METNKIIQGDVLEKLKEIPNESIDCIVTSPPYYGLRDYGIAGQIGLEKTLEEYLEKILTVTKELKRVLKPSGTLWWNHGDSYGGFGMGVGSKVKKESFQHKVRPVTERGHEKSLSLQNLRLVLRMIDEQNWTLRNTIIWHKPNCMPSSAGDRFTVDYEPVFFFSKQKHYYFEPQFERSLPESIEHHTKYAGKKYRAKELGDDLAGKIGWEHRPPNPLGRNKRCVWKIATQPFPEAHFATFPEALIVPMIKAGCPAMICKKCGKAREKIWKKEKTTSPGQPPPGTPQMGKKYHEAMKQNKQDAVGNPTYTGFNKRYKERYEIAHTEVGMTDCGCEAGFCPGIVLDCFMGAGTTAVVALKLNRQFLGIELNEKYIKIAEDRFKPFRNQLFS